MTMISPKQFMEEMKKLEPKNVVDYILRGSALNQLMTKLINERGKE